MEKLTIKAYAVRHKLSIFNVVKMTQSGQLPTETVVEDEKETVYVLVHEDLEHEVKRSTMKAGSKAPYSLRKENEQLKKEIETLKEEIARLKNGV